jgi:hypothetical protein
VSAWHYGLNDPEKLSGKYVPAWQNFGVDIKSHTFLNLYSYR